MIYIQIEIYFNFLIKLLERVVLLLLQALSNRSRNNHAVYFLTMEYEGAVSPKVLTVDCGLIDLLRFQT